MRVPIPPAWRALARGGIEPWQVVALAAAVAGGAWMLSPYSAAEKLNGARSRLIGRAPNATGRALGLTAGQLADRVQDPIEVLTMRAAVARAGSTAPTYRGGRSEFFRPVLASPPEVTWAIRSPQNLRLLGAQQPFRGEPIQSSPGAALTAADVLAAQLDSGRRNV